MNYDNQAFVFIKPHAVKSKIIDYVKTFFSENNIEIISEGKISSETIKEKGLIDKHYAINAKNGTIANPADLFLNKKAIANFAENFSVNWEDAIKENKIISGLSMKRELKITGEELRELWVKYKGIKITGGLYVSYFKDYDKYVLNGFYPSIRDIFTQPNEKIIYFIANFASEQLDWSNFRNDIIGKTNPVDASEKSIRGYFHKNNEKYDIVTGYRDNVIHASASPFEAFIEKNNWIENFDNNIDPLWNMISDKIQEEEIIKLFNDNPKTYIPELDIKQSIIDRLEDKNTAEVADILQTLQN